MSFNKNDLLVYSASPGDTPGWDKCEGEYVRNGNNSDLAVVRLTTPVHTTYRTYRPGEEVRLRKDRLSVKESPEVTALREAVKALRSLGHTVEVKITEVVTQTKETVL